MPAHPPADPPVDNDLVLDFAAAVESAVAAGRPADLPAICAARPDLIPAVEEVLRDAGQLHAARAVIAVAPPEPDEPMPERLGRYELEHELGKGAFGVAFRARDGQLNRDVAVKLLRAKFAGAVVPARRFLDEARITAQLQHPAIPPVHEVGEHSDGRPWMAMKLIRGHTLHELLGANDPALNRLAVFEAVCQGLGYAHNKGVIHRDLKPHNVMVGAFGEVQVMDWGLAKVLGPVAAGGAAGSEETAGTAILSDRESDGTVVGHPIGTPAYMSPEQAIGAVDKINRRSDVFGLGGILCHLLTGKPPFVGGDAESTRQMAARGKVQDAFARLDTCGADPELVALCKECLAPEWDDRPPDATSVAGQVATHRAAAAERARLAELDKAQAEVRADEERKRREQEMRLTAEKVAVERRRQRTQWALFVVLGGLLIGVLVVVRNRLTDTESQLRKQAERWTEAVTAADPTALAGTLAGYTEVRQFARPMLRAAAEQPITTDAGFNARVALLADEPERAAELLALVAAPVPADPPRLDQELDRLAARRAVAAVALVRAGRDDPPLWALLDHTGDTTARSYFLQQLKRFGVDPQRLADRYRLETAVARRRALVLALGEYELTELPDGLRATLMPAFEAAYHTDPDAGIHAATGWVLRQRWGQDKLTNAADAAARGTGPGGKGWFVNKVGQTFAVLPAGEFVIGADRGIETNAQDDEWPTHRRRVGPFAVAVHEVTAGDLRALLPGWKDQKDDSPATAGGFLSWYQAAEYCNRLSDKDGLPRSEWCYEANFWGDYAPGMAIAAGYLSRRGYRLPTETEWEYAARAGSPCSRYFGWSESLLPRYARFRGNGDDRLWPVGTLRPNDFGLFDALGNVLEWVNDGGDRPAEPNRRPKAVPYENRAGVLDDPQREIGRRRQVIDEPGLRLMRGGGWSDDPARNLRAARRVDNIKQTEKYSMYGLRPVQSLLAK